MENRYIPHPIHITIPTLFLFIGIGVFQFKGWEWFGAGVCLFSVATAAWIIYAGFVEERIAYWETITFYVKEMKDCKDPQIWRSLGFMVTPDKIKIMLDETTTEQREQGDYHISNRQVPPGINPAVFYNFCEAVLSGASMAENKWTGDGKLFASKPFRNMMDYMSSKEVTWIVLANKTNPKLGYELTKKGRQVFTEYVGKTQFVTAELPSGKHPHSIKELPSSVE